MAEKIGINPDDLKKIGTELKYSADYEGDLVPVDYLHQKKVDDAQQNYLKQNRNGVNMVDYQAKNGSSVESFGSVGFGNRPTRTYRGGFGNPRERK